MRPGPEGSLADGIEDFRKEIRDVLNMQSTCRIHERPVCLQSGSLMEAAEQTKTVTEV